MMYTPPVFRLAGLFYCPESEVVKVSTLSARHKCFVDEYLIDLNATQAAIRVGYSPKTAYSIGQKLLKKVEIKTAIDESLSAMHSAKTADAQEIVEYLTSVMRGQQTEEVVVVEGSGDGVSGARKIDKDVGAKDRLKAAELLGKRFGIFTENIQVSAEVVKIIDDIPDS